MNYVFAYLWFVGFLLMMSHSERSVWSRRKLYILLDVLAALFWPVVTPVVLLFVIYELLFEWMES